MNSQVMNDISVQRNYLKLISPLIQFMTSSELGQDNWLVVVLTFLTETISTAVKYWFVELSRLVLIVIKIQGAGPEETVIERERAEKNISHWK